MSFHTLEQKVALLSDKLGQVMVFLDFSIMNDKEFKEVKAGVLQRFGNIDECKIAESFLNKYWNYQKSI